ncbi:ChaN family lipoprotein [Pseudotabrizicola algicola]|uniref:ChaN family lipoprotein n=1 Tax=Pseudotabrizicola algicola TaxID=2709381 RepID=A0A6B3RRT9_9RHOB|nr:ChaN family lipoprotein [Pseudotabrizicola algicola]NEX47548.1 ChaN family lipoprotein [Pseudotabrizicola algicola]
MRVLAFTLGLFGATGVAEAGKIGAGMLDAMPRAEVVVLGEVHDNAEHHMNQARAVFSLKPRAVVWEQMTAETASRVPLDLSDREAVARRLGWAESGWPDFEMYYPIFVAAGRARHYGAEVPRELARRAVSEGALAVMPDGPGLRRLLPEAEQAAREAEQLAAHCDAIPVEVLPGMVQAQRLRDAYLAEAVLRALAEVGPPVAVITGSGHARRDWGVPAVLAEAAPGLSVLSVGQIEGVAPAAAPFDMWVVTEAVPRQDPCAAFR